MTATLTILERIVILRFDGHYVGAYASVEAAENVISAYRGHVR